MVLLLAVFVLGLFAGANLDSPPPPRIKVTAMPQSSTSCAPRPAALNPANPFRKQCTQLEVENERLKRRLSDARADAHHARVDAEQVARDMAEHIARVDREQRKAHSVWEAKVEKWKFRAEEVEGKISHYRMLAKMAESAKGMAEESKEKVWNEVRMKEEELREVKKDVKEATRTAREEMRDEVKRAQAASTAAQEEKQKLSVENEEMKDEVKRAQAASIAAQEEKQKLSEENEELKGVVASWQSWYAAHGAEALVLVEQVEPLSPAVGEPGEAEPQEEAEVTEQTSSESSEQQPSESQSEPDAAGEDSSEPTSPDEEVPPSPASPELVQSLSEVEPQQEAEATEELILEPSEQHIADQQSEKTVAEEDVGEKSTLSEELPLLPAASDLEESELQEVAEASEQYGSQSSEQKLVEDQSGETVLREECSEHGPLHEELPPLPAFSEQEEQELAELPAPAIDDKANDAEEVASNTTPAEERDAVAASPTSALSEELPALPAVSEQEEHELSERSVEAAVEKPSVADGVTSNQPVAEESELVPDSPRSVNEELYLALEEAARSPPRTVDQFEDEDFDEPHRTDFNDPGEADDDLDELEELRYTPPPAAEQHVLDEEAAEVEDAPMADEDDASTQLAQNHADDIWNSTAMDTDEQSSATDGMYGSNLDDDVMIVDDFIGVYDPVPEDIDMVNAGAFDNTFDSMDTEDGLYRPSPPSSPQGLARTLQAIDSPEDYIRSLGLDDDMEDVAVDDGEAEDQQMGDASVIPSSNAQSSALSPELQQYLNFQTRPQQNPQPQGVSSGLMQYLGSHVHDPQNGWQAAPEATQDTDMDADYSFEWENVDIGSPSAPASNNPAVPQDGLTITVPSTEQGYFRPALPPMPLYSQATSSQPTATLPGLFLKSQSTAKESPNSTFTPVSALQQPAAITKPCQHCLGSTTKHSDWCAVVISRPVFGAAHDPLCKYCLKRLSSHPGMTCPVKLRVDNDSFCPKGFVAEDDCHELDCFAFKGDCHDFSCAAGQDEQIVLLKGRAREKWVNTNADASAPEPLRLETTAALQLLNSNDDTSGKRHSSADDNPYKRQKAEGQEAAAATLPEAVAPVKRAPKPKDFKNNSVFFTERKKPAPKKPAAATAPVLHGNEMEE
jgi:hypothetical protein